MFRIRVIESQITRKRVNVSIAIHMESQLINLSIHHMQMYSARFSNRTNTQRWSNSTWKLVSEFFTDESLNERKFHGMLVYITLTTNFYPVEGPWSLHSKLLQQHIALEFLLRMLWKVNDLLKILVHIKLMLAAIQSMDISTNSGLVTQQILSEYRKIEQRWWNVWPLIQSSGRKFKPSRV